MSGTVNSMQQLFARAASLLLGNGVDAASDHDAMLVLKALEYDSQSTDRIDSERENRARLLVAASQFARVFELEAPDAPGLFSFGAQFDPVLADPLHHGSPMVGVSGVGLTLRDAFQGCIGEGIEYLSQLQAATDVLLTPGSDDWAGKPGPKALQLVAVLQERRLQPERALSWCRVTRPADGGEAWLPADICLRRPPSRRDFAPPFPLSIGSAAGPSRDAAALHGLLELIERDAASLWWRGGRLPRSIPERHVAGAAVEELLRQLRHGAPTPRRTWLLDITTDIGVPCVAAVSCRKEGAGFACGLAARPRLEAAARSAIVEMCQFELADAVVATKRREHGDDGLNAQDRIHLQRASINTDQCKLLQPVAEHAAHLPLHATEASVIFELIVRRLQELGIDTYCIDLTRERFGVPVIRVIAPGLQLEPSEVVTERLSQAVAQTGGGATYTGGVSLI